MLKLRVSLMILLAVLVGLHSCSPNPYAKTNKAHRKQVKALTKTLQQYPPANSLDNGTYWVGTTNFGIRKPNYVVIHHTAQNSCEQTLKTFTLPRTQVSAHYVICKDGTIHQMLNDYLRAHHAGVAKWGNNTDLNSSSIGIELDNNGFEYFDERQLNSLYTLLDTLKRRYNIPAANFIGHGDIAPSRKNDPNWRFPWKDLYDHGFGIWYRDTTGLVPSPDFNDTLALKLIGYDVRDTTAAISSFKRHWMQDSTVGMNEDARKVLYGLLLAL
ncbi:N-acetylmuramoyl-L-alanine amidase [Flavihumibacter petaseus]|uniref:N-acetylmuramoyl-L-alanine amidase n=1 Tax=Flavihumibacter petaseus NBRC 106054 TaxID=1220578 RepID=A0A0E9N631_9BACT|nr:N-acetylmuramoyl-L-alanine amidase [Flavihumibacter petaseus]GAO45263.1 putative N-acetylmuramoyl-L-alanine amidase [Flavihumibacter petaseus NBRC 106054]